MGTDKHNIINLDSDDDKIEHDDGGDDEEAPPLGSDHSSRIKNNSGHQGCAARTGGQPSRPYQLRYPKLLC